MIEEIRMYSLIVSGVVILVGTAQMSQWRTFGPQERLLWLSVAVFNFTAFVGSWEALVQRTPGGYRVYLTCLAVTWLLATVLYGPLTHLREWRRQRSSRKDQP